MNRRKRSPVAGGGVRDAGAAGGAGETSPLVRRVTPTRSWPTYCPVQKPATLRSRSLTPSGSSAEFQSVVPEERRASLTVEGEASGWVAL